MNPARNRATLLFVCIALFAIACRNPFVKTAEQSALPVAGGTTGPSPSPCSVPSNGNYVNDSAQVIDADARNRLEQKLAALKSKASIDFSVLTLKTTGQETIANYSLALARCWNVGGSNPDKSGLLLVLAVDDRKWHMQISRSIEKVLSNEEIQESGRLMTPYLRNRDYSKGVHEFVDATIRTLSTRRKFSMDAAK